MKILDIPQSGKRGITVSQGGRFGQISRALVIPTNPRSADQMLVRNHLASIAAQWRGLTQEQRNAWTEAGKQVNSASRLGKSGVLTGSQLYVKINMALVTIGADPVTEPPVKPDMGILPVTGLTITNVGDVVTLKLTTTADPADGTMLRAGPAISQGCDRPPNLKYCGTLDAPVANAVDISAAYKTAFGSPPVGKKVFVSVNQNINGWEDLPHLFWAIVPASA
jgi:hypothetical protein